MGSEVKAEPDVVEIAPAQDETGPTIEAELAVVAARHAMAPRTAWKYAYADRLVTAL